MRRGLSCAIGLAIAAAASPAVAAYPERPVRLVVPVAAGGGNDIVARMIAQKLTESWGRQVVVDNRPGAATAIGAEIVARAVPDGYTVMLVSVSFAINASVATRLPFDSVKDFAPITLAARVPQILVVHPALPATSVSDLIALAKQRPGEINYASAGSGSSTHLAMELLLDKAGIALNHVPYKGTAPALTDLLAGQVQVMFDAIPPSLPHIRSGRIRPIAIGSAERSASMPDLPTVGESGVPGYAFTSWFGIFAPGGTPRALVDRLNGELVRIVRLPDIRERLLAMGVEPIGSTPDELGRHLAGEIKQWSDIVQRRHIRAH
jgi:tripartite-type tricarboxylate transporter receptor subunit TctC